MRTVHLLREQIGVGPLILVNAQHPIQMEAPAMLIQVDGNHPEILLEQRAAQMLAACIQKVGGGGAIVPVSGWRSREEQQQIWSDTMAERGEEFTRRYVALPGCSEHQTGLAIDLGQATDEIDFICPAFPDSGVCGTFRRHAARYGFVERYPAGKETITNIAGEPWHFRYVGVPHAQLMVEYGLCLEEYRDFVRQMPRRVALDNGVEVRVLYQPATGAVTEVELPDACCQISGDNMDGFILTVWEGCA